MKKELLRYLGLLGFLLVAIGLGFFGLSMVFSDLGPGETWDTRIALAVLFFTISGLVLGFLSPTRWRLAGLVAWGPVLMGMGSVLASVEGGLQEVLVGLIFFMALPVAVMGGFFGKRVRRRWSNGKESN